MSENPVTVEFQAAAEKCRAQNKEDRIDYMLSNLRDAAQELENAGFRVALEVRPKLLNSATSQSEVRANAVLRVDDTSFDCVVSTKTGYTSSRSGQSECLQETSLAIRAANQDLGVFANVRSVYSADRSWRETYLSGKSSLKEALVSLVLKAKAEADVYGEYNFGAQPLTVFAKPQISAAAGLGIKKVGP